MLHRDDGDEGGNTASTAVCETYKLVADEERHPWSFPDGTFDLVISSMAFHWVNDLPKLLLEIKVSSFGVLP
jgi:SAM-dependent methyltransferase